ncbi:hypothetical protein B5E77_01690 [Lachnoclostridium sp. An131]|uniref:carbohydrate kinase family protein n=1 Tax=Lachnoclostridium sp. An131 TaxID=1965555 RepID=UPI000B398704|nr:sugar kinase [Lachnoclostridium sp. An131]OUQ28494.1 hypothetical protein B5E77_01690 [Lachnoclostridium sp. An131]
MYDITVIGAAILDVLAHPVSPSNLNSRSWPAEGVSMTVGGDAANEATILARLGKKVNLITKLGDDMAGRLLLSHFEQNGVSVRDSVIEKGLDTGINIVLVHEDAERSFITNKNGSLRKLSLSDIPYEALKKSPIFSFASIFVSPLFDVPAMAALFRSVKESGGLLCADMTRCKNGETLEDIRPILSYIDYLFPNYEEAKAVSGQDTPEAIADAFLACGLSCIVLKLGSKGCFLKNRQTAALIPACPGTRCIDTTGAGDNFAAGFLYALSEGMSPIECARFASATASIAVESVGACTGVRSLTQVMERWQNMPLPE